MTAIWRLTVDDNAKPCPLKWLSANDDQLLEFGDDREIEEPRSSCEVRNNG